MKAIYLKNIRLDLFSRLQPVLRTRKYFFRIRILEILILPKKILSQPGFRIRIHLIRIRIQRLRLDTNTDPIRIQGFYDQKLKKNYSWRKK